VNVGQRWEFALLPANSRIDDVLLRDLGRHEYSTYLCLRHFWPLALAQVMFIQGIDWNFESVQVYFADVLLWLWVGFSFCGCQLCKTVHLNELELHHYEGAEASVLLSDNVFDSAMALHFILRLLLRISLLTLALDHSILELVREQIRVLGHLGGQHDGGIAVLKLYLVDELESEEALVLRGDVH